MPNRIWPTDFIVQLPPLRLLRHRVDVAQPLLERLFLEHRHRPRGMIQRVDDFARLLDRPGGRQPDHRPILGRLLARRLDMAPGGLPRGVQEGARRAPARLALRELRLHHVVLTHRPGRAARHLVGRQIEEVVDAAARDAQPDAGEAAGIKLVAGETVQQAVLPPLLRIVARGGELRRHEQVVHHVLVAGGAAQADGVPDIVHLRAGLRGTAWCAPCRFPRLACARRATSRDGSRTGEAPLAADAVAAVHGLRLEWGAGRSPGEDAGRRAEDLATPPRDPDRRRSSSSHCSGRAPRDRAFVVASASVTCANSPGCSSARRSSEAAACGRSRQPSAPPRRRAAARGCGPFPWRLRRSAVRGRAPSELVRGRCSTLSSRGSGGALGETRVDRGDRAPAGLEPEEQEDAAAQRHPAGKLHERRHNGIRRCLRRQHIRRPGDRREAQRPDNLAGGAAADRLGQEGEGDAAGDAGELHRRGTGS